MYESASGYALFERTGGEEVGERSLEVQAQFQDFKKFSKTVHLRSFLPFSSGENALANINDLSEGSSQSPFFIFFMLSIPRLPSDLLSIVPHDGQGDCLWVARYERRGWAKRKEKSRWKVSAE